MIENDLAKLDFSKKRKKPDKKLVYMTNEIEILTNKNKEKDKKIHELEEEIFKRENEKYQALDTVAAIECDLTIKVIYLS